MFKFIRIKCFIFISSYCKLFLQMYVSDSVVLLELDSHSDHNKVPHPRTLHWSKYPSRRSQQYYISDNQPFDCTPLSGSPNCVHGNELRLFMAKAFPPSSTINDAHLTYQQQIQLLTSLAMMRFEQRIEPINFPTLS